MHFIFLITLFIYLFFEVYFIALSGMAQWIEHRAVKQRVAGSIPSQGTCRGCRPGPQ